MGRCHALHSLLPLGQKQNGSLLNENQFEDAANLLHRDMFEVKNYDAFALYIINHVANSDCVSNGSQLNGLSWVLVMRLLSTIVAHESDIA